jgi:hypothetical protein
MTPVNNPGKNPEIHGDNSFENIKGPRIISYNLNEEQRPGGLKVRFKVSIETGRKAAALNAQQAEAIRELLQWASQHQTPPTN